MDRNNPNMQSNQHYHQRNNNQQGFNSQYNQPMGYDHTNYQQMPTQNMNINMNANVDSNFMSKIALILAIANFFCCCGYGIIGIPAIICAVIALIKNRKDTMAWASIVLSGIVICFWALIVLGAFGDSFADGFSKGFNGSYGGLTDSTTTSEYSSSSEYNEEVKQTIYDENNIKIYYKGLVNDIWSDELKFYIENSSDRNIEVSCESLSINDYKMNDYMNVDVDAGLRANDTISISSTKLEENEITTIESIKGTFLIKDNDTREQIDEFDFTISK